MSILDTLKDLFSGFVLNDETNMDCGNAIFSGKLPITYAARLISIANFTNLSIGKFCAGRIFAFGRSVFTGFIAVVITLSAKKNMIWIAARRVVTRMARAKTSGDVAIGQNPCHAMSQFFAPIPSKSTVAAFLRSGSPIPANIRPRWFVDIIPKLSDGVRLGVMTIDIQPRLTFLCAPFCSSALSYLGLLSASTMAIAVWNRGMIGGIGHGITLPVWSRRWMLVTSQRHFRFQNYSTRRAL